MKSVGVVVLAAVFRAAAPGPAGAYSCPILIKEAEDLMAKADAAACVAPGRLDGTGAMY